MENHERIPDIFASLVFSEDVMRERLPKDVYKSLLNTIANGKEIEVLFETCENGFAYGHTSDFIEVSVKTDKMLHGLFRKVKLISHDGDICLGVFVE